jgi:hypothetical protein
VRFIPSALQQGAMFGALSGALLGLVLTVVSLVGGDGVCFLQRRFVVGKFLSLIAGDAVAVLDMKKVQRHGASTTKARQRSCVRFRTFRDPN